MEWRAKRKIYISKNGRHNKKTMEIVMHLQFSKFRTQNWSHTNAEQSTFLKS